jgi:chromosome segregation ATPase
LGELVYTITSGGVPTEGRSTKLFEVGQILEFDETIESIGVNTVQNRLEIQHNTNLLDLSGLGLTDSEIDSVTTDSAQFKEELEQQLTYVQNQIADGKAEIVELQKTINEANKALAALSAMGEDDDSVINKITETRDSAIAQRDQLSTEIAGLITTSTELQDKLFAVSQLVR